MRTHARVASATNEDASGVSTMTGVWAIRPRVECASTAADGGVSVWGSTCSATALTCAAGESMWATAATPEGTRLSWKQERQSTGRPWVGLNGTVVSTPQAEHLVRVSVRDSGRVRDPF